MFYYIVPGSFFKLIPFLQITELWHVKNLYTDDEIVAKNTCVTCLGNATDGRMTWWGWMDRGLGSWVGGCID